MKIDCVYVTTVKQVKLGGDKHIVNSKLISLPKHSDRTYTNRKNGSTPIKHQPYEPWLTQETDFYSTQSFHPLYPPCELR